MSNQVGIFNSIPVGIHSHTDEGNGGLLPYDSLTHFINKQKKFSSSTRGNTSGLIMHKPVDIEITYSEPGEGEPIEIYRIKSLYNLPNYYLQMSVVYRITGSPPSGRILIQVYQNDTLRYTSPELSSTSNFALGFSFTLNILKDDLIKVIVNPYSSSGFVIGLTGISSAYNMFPAYFLFEEV